METVPTIQGKQITLRKIQEKDVDDRLVLGRHHEFIHMCGGETLTEPEYPNRDTWVNWYNSAKTADYSWIIDLNGHCIGTAGFHHISEEDNSEILARVVQASKRYNFIIMRKAKKVRTIYDIWDYFNVKNRMEFFNLPELKKLKSNYNLLLNDLNKKSSWGIIDGKPVIIDYGFTKRIKERYY